MSTATAERMTLWDIEARWRELAEERFEAESIEDPAARDAALVANNEALERLASAELQKADGIIRFRETFTAMLDANGRQQQRLKARAEAIKSLLARLDSATLAAMDAVGKKKVYGSDGSYLLAKGNGGLAPLIITDESLLPDECCRIHLDISGAMWNDLLGLLGVCCWPQTAKILADSMKRVPDNAAIRAAIAKEGGVPGAYIGERSVHLEVR